MEKGSVLESRCFSSAGLQFPQQFSRGNARTMTDAADMSKLKFLRYPRIGHRRMRPDEGSEGGFPHVALL